MPVSKVSFTAGLTATPYTAGDVVGGALQFKEMPNGSELLLTSFDLRCLIAANPSSAMTSFRLHLYNQTPPSALADNTAWDLPAGDRASYAGYVDLGSVADVGSTLSVQVDQVNRQIALNGTGLFAYLVTNAGYTPAGNAESYTLTARAVVL